MDEQLLLALACGATVEGAAQKVGVSRATVQRRLRNPEFRARLQEFRTDMVKRAASTLTAAATEAIKTLLSLLQTSVPHAIRLGAARSVLEFGMKVREAADWEERLSALEQRMAASDQPPAHGRP
jgi:hypothetical protein